MSKLLYNYSRLDFNLMCANNNSEINWPLTFDPRIMNITFFGTRFQVNYSHVLSLTLIAVEAQNKIFNIIYSFTIWQFWPNLRA